MYFRTSELYFSSIKILVKQVLQPENKFFLRLVLSLANTAAIVPIPIEQRNREELVGLVKTTWARVESAELISTPPVKSDGSRLCCVLSTLIGVGVLGWLRG